MRSLDWLQLPLRTPWQETAGVASDPIDHPAVSATLSDSGAPPRLAVHRRQSPPAGAAAAARDPGDRGAEQDSGEALEHVKSIGRSRGPNPTSLDYDWTADDVQHVQRLEYLVAADCIYDDNLTDAFFATVGHLFTIVPSFRYIS